jgi:hypothetical protein
MTDTQSSASKKRKAENGDDYKISFTLKYISHDNKLSFLSFSVDDVIDKPKWFQSLEGCINRCKKFNQWRRNSNIDSGNIVGSCMDVDYDEYSLNEWIISSEAVVNSPNVRTLLSVIPEFRIKSTSMCPLEGRHGLVNVPEGATHFRWFFPHPSKLSLCVYDTY